MSDLDYELRQEHQRYNQFAKRFALRPSRGIVCTNKLLGRRCRYPYDFSCHPLVEHRSSSAIDHAKLWRSDEGYVITSEPYGEYLDVAAGAVDLADECFKLGIKVRVFDPVNDVASPHYPGRCVLIMLSKLGHYVRDTAKPRVYRLDEFLALPDPPTHSCSDFYVEDVRNDDGYGHCLVCDALIEKPERTAEAL